MKMQALVIRTAGDPRMCRVVAGNFESAELRRLRLENTVLRRNRDLLRAAQIQALRQQVDAHYYGRRVVWRVKKCFWAAIGCAAKLIQKGSARG